MYLSKKALARSRLSLRHAPLTALCIFGLSAAAFAQDQSPQAPEDRAATRIEVDEQANVIRFFIDGEQKALLDAEGLHVRGNVTFGGTAINVDQAYFDRRVAESSGGADAK